jgi:micrococcal nuclease
MLRQVSLFLALFLLLLPIGTESAEKQVNGMVSKVKDGDTVVIAPLKGGELFTCRLYGIDAPETAKEGRPGQPYGDEARQTLSRMVLG